MPFGILTVEDKKFDCTFFWRNKKYFRLNYLIEKLFEFELEILL